jgi:pimeloyl-ACP methyl ester carboxylesterase
MQALVFVAGIDGTAELFRPFEPRLAEIGWRVLYYEHTHINSWQQCADLQIFANEIRAMLDSKGVEQAVICGESFGGPITMTFARMYPERVRALILLATFAHLPFRRRAWLARQFGRALTRIAEFLPDATVRISRRIYNPSGGRHEPAALREMLRHKRTASLREYLFKSCLALGFDARAWLRSFNIPALVLTGERDRLIPTQCSREIATLLPNSCLVMIPNSGHLSHYAYPVLFWKELTGFLAQFSSQRPA